MIEHPLEYGALDLNLSKFTCDGEIAYYLVEGHNGMLFHTRADLTEELERRAGAILDKEGELTAQEILKADWLLKWAREFDSK